MAAPDFAHAPDGRRLAYSESGDPDGAPVFLLHGLPGSRYPRHPDVDYRSRHRLHR